MLVPWKGWLEFNLAIQNILRCIWTFNAVVFINFSMSRSFDIAFFSYLFPRMIFISFIVITFALFLIISFLIPFWILRANRSILSWICSKFSKLDLFRKQVAELPYSNRLLMNVFYKLIIFRDVTLKLFDFSLIYKPFMEFNNSSKWFLKFKL